MGSDYSKMYGTIPISQDISFFVFHHPHLIQQNEVKCLIDEHMFWTLSDHTINYADGRPLVKFKSESTVFGMFSVYYMTTITGDPILMIKKKRFSMKREFEIFFGDSDQKLAIRIARLGYSGFNFTLGIFLADQQKKPVIILKGNVSTGYYFAFWGNPKEGGKKIMEITRQKELFKIPKYHISIAPNCDICVMLCIALYIENLEKSRKRTSNAAIASNAAAY